MPEGDVLPRSAGAARAAHQLLVCGRDIPRPCNSHLDSMQLSGRSRRVHRLPSRPEPDTSAALPLPSPGTVVQSGEGAGARHSRHALLAQPHWLARRPARRPERVHVCVLSPSATPLLLLQIISQQSLHLRSFTLRAHSLVNWSLAYIIFLDLLCTFSSQVDQRMCTKSEVSNTPSS